MASILYQTEPMLYEKWGIDVCRAGDWNLNKRRLERVLWRPNLFLIFFWEAR